MLKISDNILIDRVALYETYVKGKNYFNGGKVKEVRVNQSRDYFVGKVQGAEIYEPNVTFNNYGDITNTSCNCPAFHKFSGDCKHIVAFLLNIREIDRSGRLQNKKSEGDLKNILQSYRESRDFGLIPVNLEVNFERYQAESYISLRIGEEKLYVVKSLGKFLSNLIDKRDNEFSKNFIFSPVIHCFKREDQPLIEFLKLLYENHEFSSMYYNGGSSMFSSKKLRLTSLTEEKFFDLMIGRKFNVDIDGSIFNDIEITDEKLELNFGLEEKEGDLILNMVLEPGQGPISSSGKYFFYDGKVYRLTTEQMKTYMPILEEMASKEVKNIRIKNDLKETFISEVLPLIRKNSKLMVNEKIESSIYSPNLYTTIYFDRIVDVIYGTVIFNYEDIEINPFSSNPPRKDPDRILLRDIETEGLIMRLLEQSDFKVADGRFFLEEEELIFDFINDIVPQLQKYADIFYSDSFKKIGLMESKSFYGGLRLDNNLDMLEFSFNIDGIDVSELSNILNAFNLKKRYYKLKDGSFLSLEDSELESIVEMMDYLDISLGKFQDGTIKIPKYRSIYLDKFLTDKEMDFIKKNIDFKKLVRDIKDPEDMEFTLPKGLNAHLRDYQVFGYRWLKTLSKYGFGGILADEMGLGKTLQVLAFLLSEKEEGVGSSIVVVPTSLVYNWEEEAKKFAPSLKTLVISGTKPERDELIKGLGNYDLIITSYPLMRRDIEEYQAFVFEHCILDEAQHIKNHGSMNARAVKNINAKQYFALTGTPMENSLSELWSIFDYLMPGYLHSNSKFVVKYERPITKDHDNSKLKDLNNHIRPFILRRLKKEVLKELPDKIEQKLVVDMTDEQKKLYLAYLQAIKGEIAEEIHQKGYNRSHIKILAGLTRLRQLCCHPGIFLEDYEGESGKLDSLVEIVQESKNGGHRLLIFSQFTSMLQKIRNTLEGNGINCMYLDGATPMLDRGELVRSFNHGQGDVFLISLKAGGTGLNLTSADMVIHYDPWWNPAVEDQATDRAHRIGQENRVQVIKLITKGTIEEKIFQLQEQKKEIIDKVIQEGETLVSKLSEEELMSLFE
ncbi:helicase [Tissierella creatinini]|nr:helicase [Tissierella creatinini]TJX64628.1 helicase [Soehngenia saccharolytica]